MWKKFGEIKDRKDRESQRHRQKHPETETTQQKRGKKRLPSHASKAFCFKISALCEVCRKVSPHFMPFHWLFQNSYTLSETVGVKDKFVAGTASLSLICTYNKFLGNFLINSHSFHTIIAVSVKNAKLFIERHKSVCQCCIRISTWMLHAVLT